MFALKSIIPIVRLRSVVKNVQKRNVQVSVIGAASDIGSNLAMLLKLNQKVSRLNLHDDDEKVRGVALELGELPGGPRVAAFAGAQQLPAAVLGARLVLAVARAPRRLGASRDQMLVANAPAVQRVCKCVADHNPDTFLAISTNPVNSIIPFASALLTNYNCYNPFRLFGITHIDTARCRAFVGNLLNVNPKSLHVPVIGGHSEETIVPLFSNIHPNSYSIDANQADMLTRLVRKAGTDVIMNKQGTEAATLAMAWSINEFAEEIIDAINGGEVTVNSFTANPHFGTRFFSGPVNVGAQGIIESTFNFNMNNFEWALLQNSLPVINREVSYGEDFVGVVESTGQYFH